MPGDATLRRLADGRMLQFLELGATNGAPVFFLPGCPDCRRIAATGAAAAVEHDVRLIAVNRPGYGRSDPTTSDHLSVARDIAEMADLLDISHYAVLGMSLGGPYALAAAAGRPDRVTAVGVIASPAPPTALKPPFHRDDLSAAQRQLFTVAAAATVAEAIELFRPEYATWVRGIAPTDPDDDALAMRWLAGMSEADRGTLTHLPSAELAAMAREALAQLDGYLRDAAVTFRRWEFDPSDIACPVWLWYGADDPNVSIRNGRWLAHAIPRATLEVLPTTTHLQALVGNWGHAFAALRVTT